MVVLFDSGAQVADYSIFLCLQLFYLIQRRLSKCPGSLMWLAKWPTGMWMFGLVLSPVGGQVALGEEIQSSVLVPVGPSCPFVLAVKSPWWLFWTQTQWYLHHQHLECRKGIVSVRECSFLVNQQRPVSRLMPCQYHVWLACPWTDQKNKENTSNGNRKVSLTVLVFITWNKSKFKSCSVFFVCS